jgi:hypothetical protein
VGLRGLVVLGLGDLLLQFLDLLLDGRHGSLLRVLPMPIGYLLIRERKAGHEVE